MHIKKNIPSSNYQVSEFSDEVLEMIYGVLGADNISNIRKTKDSLTIAKDLFNFLYDNNPEYLNIKARYIIMNVLIEDELKKYRRRKKIKLLLDN
jgi:hypothetical protein